MTNITNNYQLEEDTRQTLPDDTITTFKYDLANGHLKAFTIGGGNYIKISRIPARIKTYWNSTKDRSTAHLLNESNRGIRILKQNSNGVVMTFQNFYIWTEGSLDNINDLSENQRVLEIEISGAGAEITPLIANPSSDIFIDKVEMVSKLDSIENFSTKDGIKLPAGNLLRDIKESVEDNKQTNINSFSALKNIKLNTDELAYIKDLISQIKNLQNESNSTQINNKDEIKEVLVNQNLLSNIFYTNTKEDLQQLKQDLREDKNANIESLENITQLTTNSYNSMESLSNLETKALENNITLQDFKNENSINLQNLKTGIRNEINNLKISNINNLQEINRNVQNSNAQLQNLALETSLRELIDKISTISIKLDTQNQLLQAMKENSGGGGSTGEVTIKNDEMPEDFEIIFKSATNTDTPEASFIVDTGSPLSSINASEITNLDNLAFNQKWHYNIRSQPRYVPSGNIDNTNNQQAGILYNFSFSCNYQISYRLQYAARYRVPITVGNLDKEKFLREFSSILSSLPNLQPYNLNEDIALIPVSKNYNKPVIHAMDYNAANLRYAMTYGETSILQSSINANETTFIRCNNNYVGVPNGFITLPNTPSITAAPVVLEYINFIFFIEKIGEKCQNRNAKKQLNNNRMTHWETGEDLGLMTIRPMRW